MAFWKLLFRRVDSKACYGEVDWGESYWLWENDCYKGGEVIRIYAPSDQIESLMNRLEGINPRILLKIKAVYLRHIKSRFRGDRWVKGYLEGDREFLERLIVKAYWRWIDKAWGQSDGDLVINKEFLDKLRWVQDVEEAYESNEKEAKT